jgi:hypothetical protein
MCGPIIGGQGVRVCAGSRAETCRPRSPQLTFLYPTHSTSTRSASLASNRPAARGDGCAAGLGGAEDSASHASLRDAARHAADPELARCHSRHRHELARRAPHTRRQALRRVLQSKRLLIESRWASKPLAFAGKLRPHGDSTTSRLDSPRPRRRSASCSRAPTWCAPRPAAPSPPPAVVRKTRAGSWPCPCAVAPAAVWR